MNLETAIWIIARDPFGVRASSPNIFLNINNENSQFSGYKCTSHKNVTAKC